MSGYKKRNENDPFSKSSDKVDNNISDFLTGSGLGVFTGVVGLPSAIIGAIGVAWYLGRKIRMDGESKSDYDERMKSVNELEPTGSGYIAGYVIGVLGQLTLYLATLNK